MKIRAWHIIFIVFFVLGFWFVGIYNVLVGLDEDVNQKWSDVNVQYQRRADVIPQLVETVKGVAGFEKSTYEAVTKARTSWLNAQKTSTVQDDLVAARSFDSALSRLLVSVENYPQLKANESFLTLQAQIEGTENRVAVARKDYNAIATSLNKKVRRFPARFIASTFGFEKRELFQSDGGADEAPKIDFEFGD
jgi:LemA protein